MKTIKPQARSERLVTREVGDELLVYDLERHKAYCLNRVATQVFRHSNGQTTIPDMARRISNALGLSIQERAVRLGLARLERVHLLDGSGRDALSTTRREALRTLGKAAAVGIPLVSALTVPTAAQAVSCICGSVFSGQPCGMCSGPCGRTCSKQCVAGQQCKP